MSVEIGPKAYTVVGREQTWKGHAFCLKKTQLVGSLEVPAFLDQCSGSPVVGWRVPQTAEQDNEDLACSDVFDVQLENCGSSKLFGNVP